MSKIEEMLKNEKVEWKKLGEVCDIVGGSSFPKSFQGKAAGKYAFYKVADMNKVNVFMDKSDNYIDEDDREYLKAKLITKNAVIFPKVGATLLTNKKRILKEDAFIDNNIYALVAKGVNYKYLYYVFSNEELMSFANGYGAVPSIDVDRLKKYEIPIPSIKTQEKIVKTLDKFTEYVTELQAELQAELQYRTNQYEYYRNMLLSEEYLNKLSKKLLDVSEGGTNRLCCTTLGDIGKFTRGNGLQKSDFASHGKPVIHYGQIYTKYGFETNEVISFVSEELFEKLRKARQGDILMATTSENIEDVGKCVVWIGNEEIGFSGDMYSYRTTENPKYIAYYFQTAEFQKQKEKKVTGTKLIRIHGDDMEKFSIHLPPLSLQNKIVEILDKFQAMLSETKGLLPKEIEERQKQYEYYREKLLTFDIESGTHARTHASTHATNR